LSPTERGSFAKSTSPGTATKFTAEGARPVGGGGLRRSKTSTIALPTMCPFLEHGRGPTYVTAPRITPCGGKRRRSLRWSSIGTSLHAPAAKRNVRAAKEERIRIGT
jgi:hypothetical protein